FALISGAGLFFKADASNISGYQQAGSRQYKPMPYYQVPADIVADAAKLREWARASVAVAQATATKKKK
ncbi:MAG: TfoX/Sxy family protein, partial [Chloroflexi bacterium]|nr:TfoX/Sxy family protein [Chloroflexota bacterium]